MQIRVMKLYRRDHYQVVSLTDLKQPSYTTQRGEQKLCTSRVVLPVADILTGIISNIDHTCKGHDLGWVIWCIQHM